VSNENRSIGHEASTSPNDSFIYHERHPLKILEGIQMACLVGAVWWGLSSLLQAPWLHQVLWGRQGQIAMPHRMVVWAAH